MESGEQSPNTGSEGEGEEEYYDEEDDTTTNQIEETEKSAETIEETSIVQQ